MTFAQLNVRNKTLVVFLLLCSLFLVVFTVEFNKTNVVSPNKEKHKLFNEDILCKLVRHVEDLFKETKDLLSDLEVERSYLQRF